jgi:hypothetical protein
LSRLNESMQKPPFKLAVSAAALPGAAQPLSGGCCDGDHAGHGSAGACGLQAAHERMRLAQLPAHFHCSVIGTCLGTGELAKLMGRFIDVQGLDDLAVHHEAVGLANDGGAACKALGKALDQRHEAALRQFAKAKDAEALRALWDEALHSGEVPGAYWAVLTHRQTTQELRQKAFGDVHMLSHLVGAANRADIRRLVALERDNQELRERLERQQQRAQDTAAEHASELGEMQRTLIDAHGQLSAVQAALQRAGGDGQGDAQRHAQADLVAVQAARRERAEQEAQASQAEASQLRDELEHLRRHLRVLGGELHAAETQLREATTPGDDGQARPAAALEGQLRGRRILYVGGRPSSTPAIRSLVERHGGDFQRHDGGHEDRKGLLASAVSGAHLVVFPVDCVDHDSATNLKRLCTKLGITYLPIRNASVASFAAGIAARPDDGAGTGPVQCLRS